MARPKPYVIVRVSVDSDDAMERLRSMKDRMDSFGIVFEWAKRELERAYSRNFTTMGAESARAMLKGAWPPLDPEYASWKARNQPTPMMIGPTGRLFRSVADLARSASNTTSDTEASFYIDSPIARFHQSGTENMPARKLLFVPRDFDREFGKKVVKYVSEGSKIT